MIRFPHLFRFTLCFSSFILGGPQVAAQTTQVPDDQVSILSKLISEGNREEALRRINALLVLYPNDTRLAKLKVSLGDVKSSTLGESEKAGVPPRFGERFTIPKVEMDMLPISPDSFKMVYKVFFYYVPQMQGSGETELIRKEASEEYIKKNTKSINVELTNPYWIGKYEVTQSQWKKLMDVNPSHYSADENNPVDNVDWEDCVRFIHILNGNEASAGRLPSGYAYSLPTQAQWEYAARAGSRDDYPDNLDRIAWYQKNTDTPRNVGIKMANQWGVFDMFGNVSEWCLDQDAYFSDLKSKDDFILDYFGIESGSIGFNNRVIRGGSFASSRKYELSYVYRQSSGIRHDDDCMGFRIVLSKLLKSTSIPSSPTLPSDWKPKNYSVKDTGITINWISPGSGQMGSKDGKHNEKPPVEITLTRGFWMSQTEITRGQWNSKMGYQKMYRDFPEESNYPINGVTWFDAMEFCEKMNKDHTVPNGYEYRLPTEAEWEYACRAGAKDGVSSSLDEHAWYDKNSNKKMHPVATKKPNAFGLFDMQGNVWEWCADWYAYAYDPANLKDPAGRLYGADRVIRGGAAPSSAEKCRQSHRIPEFPHLKFSDTGFRIVLGPKLNPK